MLLIPAIDLKEGKCVRLRQGRMEDDTVFSDDPVAVARRWVEKGARRLHLVDLDGAFAGRPRNEAVIRDIVEAVPDVPVQVGGGIRDEDTVDAYIEAGVRYVIIGSKAVSEPHFVNDVCMAHPGHIIVGLDARDGRVAVNGWAKLSRFDAVDLAQKFERDGVEAIVYTDIARDGMMQGLNLEATTRLAEAINIPVIASGGVTDMGDIERLCGASGSGVIGTIIGRALYEGSLELSEAQQYVDDHCKTVDFGDL